MTNIRDSYYYDGELNVNLDDEPPDNEWPDIIIDWVAYSGGSVKINLSESEAKLLADTLLAKLAEGRSRGCWSLT